MKRLLKRFLRPLLERLYRRLSSLLLGNPYVHGKLLPLGRGGTHSLVVKADGHEGEAASGDLPVPPEDLLAGYGVADYLETGKRDVATMLGHLREVGASPDELTTVLDLGSGSARMVRAFPRGPHSEIWGLDISAEHVGWCQDHMSPPLHFATVTTAPHLPFEDGYFDLIYCGSVFTHIRELADAWILEMRRALRKGGYMYVTIHDQRTVELLLTKYRDWPGLQEMVGELERLDGKASIREGGYEFFWYGSDPYSHVFYNRDYLVKKWSAFGTVEGIKEEAYEYQTAVVLRK